MLTIMMGTITTIITTTNMLMLTASFIRMAGARILTLFPKGQ
jgi:hypothetical protein